MHGLSLPIKTVTGLIEVLSVGFPMLFSADASCTVMSKEQGSLEEQVQSIHISDDESDDTLPNETPKLSVFKDKDDGCFTAFMKDSRIIKIIEEYFKNLNHIQREEYENNINEINEIVGMKLYNYCTETMSGCLSKDEILNEDGSLKEKIAQQAEGYFEISFKEWESKFKRIEVSGFEFDHIPTKALKFLTEYLETDELSISETTIDIAALNSSDLSKITTLLLTGVGLTEIPCLSELTGLEYMCLDNNRIEHISLQNYFDDKTRKYKPMIGLRHLDLYGNPISKVNISITKVFTNKSILISMDKTRLRYPFSNMKKKLDKVDIELIEKDLESENESDVKS